MMVAPRKPLSNRCPEGDTLDRIATALEAGNDMARQNVAALSTVAEKLDRIVPLAEGVGELNERLTKLCNFVVGHRLKIAAAIIAAISTPGLLAPEVLAAIKAGLAALGSS